VNPLSECEDEILSRDPSRSDTHDYDGDTLAMTLDDALDTVEVTRKYVP
jgi:hypothetical protein